MLHIRKNMKTLNQLLKWYEDEMFSINEKPNENLEFFDLINLYFPLNIIISLNIKEEKGKFKIINNEKFLITVIYFLLNKIKIENKYFNECHRSFQRKIEEKDIDVTIIEHENDEEEIGKIIKQYKDLN
jgi:hypothetical protein